MKQFTALRLESVEYGGTEFAIDKPFEKLAINIY